MKNKKLKKGYYSVLCLQRYYLLKKFNFLECKVNRDHLVCKGSIQVPECPEYNIKIRYDVGSPPKVFILSPDIIPSPEIHMYKDKSLCLYFPPDMPWKDNIKIADFFISWIIEWITFYELWLIRKKWEGREAPHSI
jgi:hypothetical protein